MSSIEVKLRNFERTVINRAAQDRDAMLAEIDAKTAEVLREAAKQYEAEARELFLKGMEDVKKEARSIVSAAKNKGQTHLVHVRNEIIDSVFEELTEKLRAFTETPEYDVYFTKRAEAALKMAAVHLGDRQGKVKILLTAQDFAQRKQMVQRLAERVFMWASVMIETAAEDLIGGCRVEIPEYGKVIDNSMRSDVLREKEEFLSWSNLSLK